MDRENDAGAVPIACTLDRAAFEQRLSEFGTLFRDELVGRERTERGIRFRFANREQVETQVRDLAARELECCSFFAFDITVHGDEVWWDASVADVEAAGILDDLYELAGQAARS